MNKLLIHINRFAIAALFLSPMLMPSCMHDDYGACEPNSVGNKARSYVSLSFYIPSSETAYASKRVKANPGGGEQGDGQENGQGNENIVGKAAAFLYDGAETVNSDATTPVTMVEFETVYEGNDGLFTTKVKPVELPNGSYRVLVVVNPSDLSWAKNDAALTLGKVRDRIESEVWISEAGGNESAFLMASADEAEPLVLASNSSDKPATTSVQVERVAARIDYKANGSYECTDQSGTVEVLGAAMVNRQQKGSYLLKRVADDVNGTNLKYLGIETADGQGVPTNYVLDPYTPSKTAGWAEASTLYAGWFGNIDQNPNHWEEMTKPGTELIGGDNWKRIGYTQENTADRLYADSRYNTGVVFKARFTPKQVTGAETYEKGTTFFARGSTLFVTMETVMEHTFGKHILEEWADDINLFTNWNEVRTFAQSNKAQKADPSGYLPFVMKQAEEAIQAGKTDITEAEKESLQWKAYMLAECGYSLDTGGKVKLDQKEGVSTREVLLPFGVRTYENGICYYVWWVRHGNDNDDAHTGVMEYAIVRNNVYKINVRSFHTLGGDVPGEEEPVVEVYVKNWTLLQQEDLPM